MTMLARAASDTQLTTGEQVAFVCMVMGAVVIVYTLARGAAYLLLLSWWLLGRHLWRAHRRGVERVRRFETREAERGRRRPGRAVRARDAVRGVP